MCSSPTEQHFFYENRKEGLGFVVLFAFKKRSSHQQALIQDLIQGGVLGQHVHSGRNLVHLLRIAIEELELSRVAFDKILDLFKEKSRHIDL